MCCVCCRYNEYNILASSNLEKAHNWFDILDIKLSDNYYTEDNSDDNYWWYVAIRLEIDKFYNGYYDLCCKICIVCWNTESGIKAENKKA
jgi:hypothetical protein